MKADEELFWHQHGDADELFLITSGELRIEFRQESNRALEEGGFLIVPESVEHRPVAESEVEILLFESSGTRKPVPSKPGPT